MTLYRLAALAALAFSAPALAQPAQQRQSRPQALTRVLDCRSITVAADRLACFDREVAAMEAAEAGRQLVVMDRQQIRRTRRSLFGLTLPNLGIFGGDDDDQVEEENRELETTIRSASQDPDGKWILTLADGARWVQIDTRDLPIDPRPGHSIRIRRAALGSYIANVNRQIGMRVRRER